MTKPDPRRFDQLLAFYLDGRRSLGRSHESERNLTSILTRFLVHLRDRGVVDIRATTEADVAAYVRMLDEHRTARGRLLSPVTRESSLVAVKVFLAFLERRRLILRNPAAGVSMPRVERLPHAVLSVGEARRLVSAPSQQTATGKRDRAILELLYGSGLRGGEGSRLDISDLDLLAGTVFVRNGKGRRDRVVPLTPHARAALTLYLRDARPELARNPSETALFVSWRTLGRLTRAGLQTVVRKHAQAAGIVRPVSTHALRHSCATHLLQGGAGVKHIQEILGHKSVRSTMLYTRVEPVDLRRVVARAHPRERERSHGRLRGRR